MRELTDIGEEEVFVYVGKMKYVVINFSLGASVSTGGGVREVEPF